MITLDKDGVYTGPFVLPNKAGSSYIVVTTEGFAVPVGTRVSHDMGSTMACIVGPDTRPAISTATAAHHFRFIGLEIKSASGQYNYGLVLFGTGEETDAAQFPHHLILDRCYVHGDSVVGGKRGVMLGGDYLAVVDSYLSHWKGVGQDTQAICGWTGRGPWKIENNYIEGAGENLLVGGADTRVPNLTPSDITIRGNKFVKPMSWKIGSPTYAGTEWSIKNLLELKHAQRVLIADNTFENCWAHAQVGFAIVFTVRNQSGTNPWATVSDVTFTRNVIRNSANAFNLMGIDNESGVPSQSAKRLLVDHNLATNIGGENYGDGILFQILSGYEDISIDHNTALHTGTTILADYQPNPRFQYINNIAQHNQYGIFGSNYGVGNPAITYYFPGSVVRRNVLVGADASIYPVDNYFPPDVASVGFASDLKLLPTSPYHNAATDGTDIGY